jgi:hypothetical protein
MRPRSHLPSLCLEGIGYFTAKQGGRDLYRAAKFTNVPKFKIIVYGKFKNNH